MSKKKFRKDLSIIIVNWNGKKLLEQCLKSIIKYTVNIDFEIIVVDNNSSDESISFLNSEYPDVKTIVLKSNTGFAHANNVGFREANGRYVAILNNDTILIEDIFIPCINYLSDNPNTGAIGPKLINEDYSRQFSTGRFPTIKTEISESFFLKRIPLVNRIFPGRYHYKPVEDTSQVEWLSGACIVFPKAVLDKTGYFDDNYFMYMEDIDIAKKIKSLGKVSVFLPDIRLIHIQNKSFKSINKDVLKLVAKSEYFFFSRHYNVATSLLLKSILYTGHLLRFVIFLFAFIFTFTNENKNRVKYFLTRLKIEL